MKRIALIALSLFFAGRCFCETPAANSGDDQLQKLAQDFWNWRARYAPFTADDVNRIERPGGTRDWSGAAIEKRRADLKEFEARWKQIDASQWPISQQVDYRLIGSALARVHWELEINPRWKRDPNFYLDQTLTALAEALTVPAPYDEARSREILIRIKNIPSILKQGDREPGRNRRRHLRRSRFNLSRASANACSEWRARSRRRPRFSEEELNDAVRARGGCAREIPDAAPAARAFLA